MININIQDNHINIGIIGTGRIAARFLEENKKLSSNVKIMETHIRITVAKLEVFPVRCKVSAL